MKLESNLTKLALFFVLLLGALIGFASPSRAANTNLRIVNVRHDSFTVTWLTDSAVVGQVRKLGGEMVSESDYVGRNYQSGRGASFVGRTHFVVVKSLLPNTTYQFDLVSGNEVDDNNGQHYTVTTGAGLSTTASDLITGKMLNPDGSLATDAIVYVRLKSAIGFSAWLAAPAPTDLAYLGAWLVYINDARTEDLTGYFPHTAGDQAEVQASAATGSWAGTANLTALRQGQNFQIALTPYPPTATPTGATLTPSITPTRTATLTNTLTPTMTPTLTPTLTPTPTVTPTHTEIPSSTPTKLLVPSSTSTSTATPSLTETASPPSTEAATRAPLPGEGNPNGDANESRVTGPVFLLLVGLTGLFGGGLLIALAVYLWRRQNAQAR